MSKNIMIQEGGEGKNLTVDKLKTNLVGGGSCLWVPEDEVQLTTKSITANGTYKASDDGSYGYSEVTVSGIGRVTGTDEAGDEATVHTGSGGGLVQTKIPSTIVVETPPTVTIYSDGETIDFTGMVVKGYLKSGNLWTDSSHPDGIIPISELTLPVTQAEGSAAKMIHNVSSAGTHLMTLKASGWPAERTYTKHKDGDAFFALCKINLGDWLCPITIGRSGDAVQVYVQEPDGGWESITGPEGQIRGYYFNALWGMHGTIEYSDVGLYGYFPTRDDAVNYMIDQIDQGEYDTGGQIIPVQYIRPGDGTILESSFEITVNNSFGGAIGGGGQAGENGAGRND